MFGLLALMAFVAGIAAEPQGLGGAGAGYATYFEGFGIPYGGCGVPQSWTVDDNGKALPFVALNTFADQAGARLGMFDGGRNCGRWLRMTACSDCKGGSNDQWRVCIKGDTDGLKNYAIDGVSGTMLYGYVADSCGDFNHWCRTDRYHVDVSQPYLQDYVSRGLWGNRLVNWEFIDGPPAGWTFAEPIKFGWAQGAYLPYYPAIIVHGATRGVSRVQVKTPAGYKDATMNGALGQMWVLSYDGTAQAKAVIRVLDARGRAYPEYEITFPCKGTCATPTKAPARRLN